MIAELLEAWVLEVVRSAVGFVGLCRGVGSQILLRQGSRCSIGEGRVKSVAMTRRVQATPFGIWQVRSEIRDFMVHLYQGQVNCCLLKLAGPRDINKETVPNVALALN